MIVESIVLGLTTIIVSSFVFVSHVMKMEREDDRKDDSLAPFIKIMIGTQCPMCGIACTKERGLRQPKACPGTEKCEEVRSHLHAECTICDSKWIMATGLKNDDDTRTS